MSKKEKKEPKYIPSPINNPMLNYRYYYMSFREKSLFSIMLFVIGGFIGYIFYGGLFKEDGTATGMTYISNVVIIVVTGIVSVRIFIPMVAVSKKNKRDRKLRDQFLGFLNSLVVSLSSGSTFIDAVRSSETDLLSQFNRDDYIIIELSEINAGIDNGQTLETMLYAFSKRSGNEDIENFSNIINNCYGVGGDFKSVVRKTRDIISEKNVIADEVETKIASNKLQHNAMTFMPIGIVSMMKLMSSNFADNLASLPGVLITTLAVILFIASYFWGKKIIDIR